MNNISKEKQLQKLLKKMLSDKNLPLSSNLILGEGNPDTDILFIGEAPGKTENELKRPFVGRSGKLLDKMIESIGWKREDIYITNIIKRQPPLNRDPTPKEIEKYKPYLKKQIEIIKPKIIAPLGRFSMNYFLPLAKISHDQGKLFLTKDNCIYPIFHPAAAIRATSTMKEFQKSFRHLPNILKGVKEFKQKNKKRGKTKNNFPPPHSIIL